MGLVNRRVRGLFLLALVMTWGALPPSHAQRLSQNPPGFCQDLLATAPLSPAELFSSEWPKERRKLFLDRLVERAGITLSSQTLVQNSLTLEEAQGRIAPNFADLRRNLRAALSKGKKLLVLNGSFDLVHAGHVGMVQASLHNFMIRENLRREEVYLVVLADADPLIFSSKKHKWVKFGGSESLPRPLQSLANIQGSGFEVHPRALDLANLGADLVGLTPSPYEFAELAHQPWFLNFLHTTDVLEWQLRKEEVLAAAGFTPDQEAEIHQVFEIAARMFSAFLAGQGHLVVKDFEEAGPGEALPHWHVSSWQMLLQYSLGLGDFPEGSVHKTLNLRDSEYLHNVVSWSQATGQTVSFIDGTDVYYSTTELLKTFSMEELLALKQRFYPAPIPAASGL